jgi:hypothetical protein
MDSNHRVRPHTQSSDLSTCIDFNPKFQPVYPNKLKDKFTIKGANLSEGITEIWYPSTFDIIPLLNRLSKMKVIFSYRFKYLCSSLSINVNQFGKF